MDFRDIQYLKNGNPAQQSAYRVLTENMVFQKLSQYTPILAGTVPIEIDIPGSDLDIICSFLDKEKFKENILRLFAHERDFSMREKADAVVANFFLEQWEIEIYASENESENSNGFRHMLIEHRILKLTSPAFRERILELKISGMKTEPAFGKLLGIQGDFYEELLKLQNLNDRELSEKIPGNLKKY